MVRAKPPQLIATPSPIIISGPKARRVKEAATSPPIADTDGEAFTFLDEDDDDVVTAYNSPREEAAAQNIRKPPRERMGARRAAVVTARANIVKEAGPEQEEQDDAIMPTLSTKRPQPRVRARLLEKMFMEGSQNERLKRDLRAGRATAPHKSRRMCQHTPPSWMASSASASRGATMAALPPKPPPSAKDGGARNTAPATSLDTLFKFDVDADGLSNAFDLLAVGAAIDDDANNDKKKKKKKKKKQKDKTAPIFVAPSSSSSSSTLILKPPGGSVSIPTDEWGVDVWPPPLARGRPPIDTTMYRTPDGVMMRSGMDLFPHQRQSRDEMRALERNPHRGACGMICAPVMGLGKTCITLALVAADKDSPPGWHSNGDGKSATATSFSIPGEAGVRDGLPAIACFRSHATLVVCPLLMIDTWVDEVRKFHGSHLRVMVFRKEYLGNERWSSMQGDELLRADIVITSYETVTTVAKEMGMGNCGSRSSNVTSTTPPLEDADPPTTKKSKKLPPLTDQQHRRIVHERECEGASLLLQVEWERIVADESQRLSNPSNILYEAMSYLQSRYRQCLTGTPFSNYDTDLWAQFRWLGYTGTARKRDWSESRSRAHNMQKCILVMNYKSAGITLPPCNNVEEVISLDGDELCLYRLLFCMGRRQLKSEHSKNRHNALVILNYLRQVCISPYMLAPRATEVLLGQMDARIQDKITLCAGDPNMRGFNHSGNTDGTSAVPASSPFLVAVGQICSRPQLVATMQHVLDKYYPGHPHGHSPEAAKTHLAHLERWVVDINGTAGIQSAKMQRLVQVIAQLIGAGHKLLVFSAFTKALSLLRHALVAYGVVPSPHSVAWLTGSVNTPEARAEQLRRFRETDECAVLMMTFRVGSSGLNLTEATAVLCIEKKWNDVDRVQAKHRAWRIGQTQPVTAIDFLVNNTIEERMKNLCISKEAQGKRMVGGAMIPQVKKDGPLSSGDLEFIMTDE